MIYRPHTQFRHHHRRAGESPLDWLFSSRSAFSSRLQSLYARYFMYSNRIILDHWSEFPTYLVDMDSTLIAQNVQTYHLCDCQVSVAEHSALPISEFETVFLTKWHLQKVLPFFIVYFSPGSVATYLRCGGKNDKYFIANSLLNPKVKEL